MTAGPPGPLMVRKLPLCHTGMGTDLWAVGSMFGEIYVMNAGGENLMNLTQSPERDDS